MSKKRKNKRYLGYFLSHADRKALAVVALSATQGSYKRLKSEADFWDAVERKHGVRRQDGESFIGAVHRVRKVIRSNRVKRVIARENGPSKAFKDDFYMSWEWRTLRMEVLKEHGRACQCCGAKPGMKDASGKPVRVVVDHIKPLSKFWSLRLDRSNLQILCDECNQGKGAWDETDWRDGGSLDETEQTDPLTAAFRETVRPEVLQ